MNFHSINRTSIPIRTLRAFRRRMDNLFDSENYLTNLTKKKTNCIVSGGPFRGMKYVQVAHGSAYIPKLLGIYERELAPLVDRAIARQPRLVVDVGAAEGYYAIGMALKCPQARVLAFEMQPAAQCALREMAVLNGVQDRVEVRDKCEHADLKAALGDESDALVICDAEGCEKELLDLSAVPALRHLPICVELHDFIVPAITELIFERFSQTHEITHIWQEDRRRSDFPWRGSAVRLLSPYYVDQAVSELRPVRMAWFWMEPKTCARKTRSP